VFRRLNELQAGSGISIERGDGGVDAYQVESIETVRADTVNMADVLVPFNRSSEGLNLIGCAGSYDSKTNDFANRVIIFAVRI
jgi:sortase (surface protein transpeptidase)